MITFSTDKQFHGYSVQYNPFSSARIACVASKNFGLKGNGCLYLLSTFANDLKLDKSFIYEGGLYDLAWSECNGNILITASNDSNLQMWNTEFKEGPVKLFGGHKKEVNSVAWSLTRDTQLFVSGSWDSSIKLWDPDQYEALNTFNDHHGIVYCVAWSPHLPAVFMSCSGDGDVRLWDVRHGNCVNMLKPGCGEILSCDWTKYESTILVTGGTDSSLRVWDFRSPAIPVKVLTGHNFPARRIKCSPHFQHQLASVSYDKTLRIWDYSQSSFPIETLKHHSEFVTGIDFSLSNPNEATSTVDAMEESNFKLIVGIMVVLGCTQVYSMVY
eukprot:gene45-639_t